MKLFTLGEDYLVTINREWISTIEEFKVLLKRDKSRDKKDVIKEFTYIYHLLDFASQFVHLNENERKEQALLNAGLQRGDIDVPIQNAIDKYKELQETRSLKLIRSGFNAIDKLANYYTNVTEPQDADEAKKLTDAIKGIGKILSDITELEKQVKKDIAEDAGIRGGREKGDREDPGGNGVKFTFS